MMDHKGKSLRLTDDRLSRVGSPQAEEVVEPHSKSQLLNCEKRPLKIYQVIWYKVKFLGISFNSYYILDKFLLNYKKKVI